VAIVRRTRESESLHFGASPRASLDLWRYSQALALLRGRGYVLPDDVKDAAAPVLAHRLIVRRGSRHATVSSDSIVGEILTQVEVPV
jgi:MoxR-like ATPase